MSSILLAFGIDAWWENVKDGRSEAAYLSRLEADLRVDLSEWDGQGPVLSLKQAALDRALSWIQAPDEAPQAIDQLLEDLAQGTIFAYEGGFVAQSATFDELISSGTLGLLSPEVRTALQNYYRLVETHRARLAARQTGFAPAMYGLIPRESEFIVLEGLDESYKARVAEQILTSNIEALVIAERNRGRARQGAIETVLEQAQAVVDLLVAGRSK